mmetsp:Transcript_83496/g.221517  ORF Transcript_83496/g.221517 Transcript_83496/m.221517 type:complete len:557 (-) Transcript_83496:116-1786(-)
MEAAASPRPTPRATPRTPGTGKSVTMVSDSVVSLQIQEFLDDWHYRVMNSLGQKVSATQALKYGLEILAINGVDLSESDIKSMVNMDDKAMLSMIVERLPPAMREDFEHLALQLQMLVTTSARVRKTIEEGVPENIQGTIEEVDSTSIGQQILKQAVVQASREVASLHRCQDTWFRSMEKRLDRLTRSAEYAEHAQQQLLAVETQLQTFGAEQNAKSKKALMGFAQGNDKSLLSTVFSTWNGIVLSGQGEKAIRMKYEKEIADAEKKLFEYKEKQLAGVKSSLMRSARDTDQGLLNFCVQTWAAFIAENKRDGVNKQMMMELEGKLQTFQSKQSDNTKKVMARLGSDQDSTVMSMAWSAWMTFLEDYKKNKEFEDKVKETEAKMAEFMKKKKEDAKTVLDRMNGATDSGLMAMCLQNWYNYINDFKKAKRMEEKMAKSTGNLSSMKIRQKGNAMNVQGRINEQIKANLIFRCFGAWSLESKVNHIDRYYTNKMNHKRQQLSSVQTLFKSFAKQLEEGLGNIEGPEDTYRTRAKVPGMAKDHNSVSLPDIHARPLAA